VFDNYSEDQLNTLRVALTDRIDALEAGKDEAIAEFDFEIHILETSVEDVDHALASAPNAGKEPEPVEDDVEVTVHEGPTPPSPTQA
jgi:hypothetical protein